MLFFCRRILSPIFVLLAVAGCTRKTDDLQKVSARVDRLMTEAGKTDDESLRKSLADSAWTLVKPMANNSISRKLRTAVVSLYLDTGNDQEAMRIARDWLADARKANDVAAIGASAFEIAEQYYGVKHDSAFKYYLLAEKSFKTVGDTLNYGKSVLNKSGVLYHSGNFTEGINQGILALKLLLTTNDTRSQYDAYVKIALSLKEVNDYDGSLQYFMKSFEPLERLAKNASYDQDLVRYARASNYNNIGTLYERKKQYAQAISYYDLGLRTQGIYAISVRLYSTLINNRAYAMLKMGRGTGVEQAMMRALEIRDSLQFAPGMISSRIKLGELALWKKDTVKAISWFRQGFELAKHNDAGAEMLQTLKFLVENDKRSDQYAEVYFRVNDSIRNAERATQDKFARIAFETEEVEAQNLLLSRRNKIIIVVSIFALLGAGVLLALIRLRAKNRELEFVRGQQQANEQIYRLMLDGQQASNRARNEERNRIAMELHDGIVNSVFTTRFNLMQLESAQDDRKQLLVEELAKTESEIRRVSHDLQKNMGEGDGFADLLRELVGSQPKGKTEFDFSADKFVDWSAVSSEQRIHLYRIVQEALQNVHKYANAERCFVMFLKTDGQTTLRIWDNGVGFDATRTRDGIGLSNMRQRAESMGADFSVRSEAGKGTTIEVVF